MYRDVAILEQVRLTVTLLQAQNLVSFYFDNAKLWSLSYRAAVHATVSGVVKYVRIVNITPSLAYVSAGPQDAPGRESVPPILWEHGECS